MIFQKFNFGIYDEKLRAVLIYSTTPDLDLSHQSAPSLARLQAGIKR